MFKKLFLISISLLFFIVASSSAEKKEKPKKLSVLLKSSSIAIKNSSGQENVQKELLANVNREDFSAKDKSCLYYNCALLDESMNSVQNTKAYLKQNYDTIQFFNTLYKMYKNLELCDSLDAIPNSQGNVVLKYRSKSNSLRKKHARNIYNGSKFFLKKGDLTSSYKFIDTYCTYADSVSQDTLLPKLAFWASWCAYESKYYDGVLKYVDKAINNLPLYLRPILQEYKTQSYQNLKKDSLWLFELKKGVKLYPSHDFFFVHLADYYYSNRMFEDGHNLADSLISINPNKAIYWYTKCKYEFAENDYYKCIEYADSTLSRDSLFIDAYYNKGISYLNLALIHRESACTDMADPKCLQDQKSIQGLYDLARPCMEMVRKLSPEDKERWGVPLYRIYMFLNKGKEFDEIDKLLHEKKS